MYKVEVRTLSEDSENKILVSIGFRMIVKFDVTTIPEAFGVRFYKISRSVGLKFTCSVQ